MSWLQNETKKIIYALHIVKLSVSGSQKKKCRIFLLIATLHVKQYVY